MRRFASRCAPALLTLGLVACGSSPQTETSSTGAEDTTGDGDGDPGDGDGDGDPGDGDGDGDGDTDDGADMPTGPCDSFAQDCPDGQKCVPYSSEGGPGWDAHKCVPVLGANAAGEACVYGGLVDSTDDCDADTFCWNTMDIDGELVGVCTPFCLGEPDAPICPEGSSCTISGQGVVNLCLESCHPLLQGCLAESSCVWGGTDFWCVTGSGNDAGSGEECALVNDCAVGLDCVDSSVIPGCQGVGCCADYCDITEPDTCEQAIPGTQCTAFFAMDAAPEGYEDVGLCVAD
ncbi:hypothetical protein ENSA5_47130 [Enhygromyxa salina]|uniref:Endo-1,4-beta-xylanase A n=1 Tax=Enhygromyxa salina TaxID=215803 RepID=A0A2S9XJ88_9BACT|nr:ribulose phosphate epimerase [Enhygromyxa salina]PRP92800.1 hypothetical protein ENSA5_47130 [Enhygromyxa salina]